MRAFCARVMMCRSPGGGLAAVYTSWKSAVPLAMTGRVAALEALSGEGHGSGSVFCAVGCCHFHIPYSASGKAVLTCHRCTKACG